MENRIIQYISIIAVLATIVGSYFYFRSEGSVTQKQGSIDGLVGYWDFEEGSGTTVYDRSSSGNNGTITGATYTNGRVGGGMNFNGTSDYIDLGTSALNFARNDSLTISMWIKPEKVGMSKGTRLIGKRDESTYIGWQINYSGNNSVNERVTFSLGDYYNGGVLTINSQGELITYNDWNHIMVTYNGSSLASGVTWYINGSEATGGTGPSSVSSISGTTTNSIMARIGSKVGGDLKYFNGRIDEIRAYNRELSAAEAADIYNSQKQTIINASQETKLTDGLIFHHTFDGNHMDWSQAAVSRDQAGTAHGTLYGSPVPTPTPGKIGQALEFVDWINYADFGNSTAFNSTITEFTVSEWVNLRARRVYDNYLGKSGVFSLGIDADYFGTSWSAVANAGAGFAYATTNIEASDIGEWHLWTLVYDGSGATNADRLKFYRDTTQHAFDFSTPGWYVDIPTSISDNSNSVMIGSPVVTSTKPDAKLDEARIYNRALSVDEITELYNLGQTKINASQETKLTDGLVGNWTFDGNHMDWGAANEVLDQGTGGNDGNLNVGSSSPTAAIGKVGQALDFDGSNDYIDTGSPNLGFSGFAYCAWIYPEALTGNHIILHYNNAADNDSLGLRLSAGGLLDVFDGNLDLQYTTQSLSVNNWYHVCATSESMTDNGINDDLVNMYVNGVLGNGYGNRPYNPWLNSDHLYISNPIWGNAKFNGKLDEVRIYNRGLTADEINQLYMMGRSQ